MTTLSREDELVELGLELELRSLAEPLVSLGRGVEFTLRRYVTLHGCNVWR